MSGTASLLHSSKAKIKVLLTNCCQKGNFVVYLSEWSRAESSSATQELCYLSWAGYRGAGGVADKYSNEMSAPLWVSGAHIHDIPG